MYYTIQAADNKGADQIAQADLRLCCSHLCSLTWAFADFKHAHLKKVLIV